MTATSATRPGGARASYRPGLRIGPVGLVVRRRALVVAVLLLLALVGLLLVSLLTGALALDLGQVREVLAGEGSRIERLVVERRVVRATAAVLIGFALGAAGGLTQSITRNPIATPDILGVTAGAAAVAVLFVTSPAAAAGEMTGLVDDRVAAILPTAALVGGLATTALVLALAWRGGFDSLRLILVGIGVNALATAVTAWALTRAEIEDAQVAMRWLVGSVAGVRAQDLTWLAPVCLLAVVACVLLARDLAALRLGQGVASALGTRVAVAEGTSLVVAVLLVSVATAVAGPIGFVAFVAPQVALRLFGTGGPPPLAGGLAGAVLLLGADLVGESLPSPLPVGVVTAVIGAPCLLYLLVSRARRTGGQ